MRYFDIDPDHADRISKFEQIFNSGYVEPGSFEVYDKSSITCMNVNQGSFLKLLPFSPDKTFLDKIDFDRGQCFFYIAVDKVDILDDGYLSLVGPIEIEKFDYEY